MSSMSRQGSSSDTTTHGPALVPLANHDDSMTTDSATRVILPLSSSILNTIPDHPLILSLFNPVLPRIAYFESLLLQSPFARLFRNFLGLPNYGIIFLSFVGIGGLLARWRDQWRVMLTVLGLTEAVANTFKVLAKLDRGLDEDEEDGDGRLDSASREERLQGKKEATRQDMKHALSFWLLFSLLGILESIRSSSSTVVPLSTRLAPFTQVVRSMLRRTATRWPRIGSFIPSRLSSVSAPNPSTRRPFPQPRAHPSRSLATNPSLPVALFASEARYRVFKLLLLWQGLRRDYGASILWDYLIGPIFAVYYRRRKEQQLQALKRDGSYVLPPARRRRVVNLVVSEEEEEAYLRMISGKGGNSYPSSSAMHDHFPTSSTSSTGSSSTATSPSMYRNNRSLPFEGEEGDSSFDSIASSTSSAEHDDNTFPTPNVPFRLTSSSHPIRSHSFNSQLATTTANNGFASTRFLGDSPTPVRRISTGGYEVEDSASHSGFGGGGGGRLNWGSSSSSTLPIELGGERGWDRI